MNFLELPLFQSLSDQELEQMKTSGCLRTASYKNTTQPSCNVQPQKFDALRTDFLHFFKNSSQPTADLSVRTVPETRQPSFSDSVRPAANGRLPESGSQCPVKRTFPYEKRRDLRFSQKRICFKK